MRSSSCRAMCPLPRRIALRSHERPRTSRSAPTTTRNASMGTYRINGTPTTTTRTPSTSAAATAPQIAERQPRLTPAATTRVNASTISTRLAPKTARTRTSVDDVLCMGIATEVTGPVGNRRSRRPAVVCRALTRNNWAKGDGAMGDGSAGQSAATGGPAGRDGRNYVVVSADTHASPDSLEHFLSYVDAEHCEAVAAFGDMSST